MARVKEALTDAICQQEVEKQTKVYDNRCKGLYASIAASGGARFMLKYYDKQLGKQRSHEVGEFHPVSFTVEIARQWVSKNRSKVEAGLLTCAPIEVGGGITFDELAEAYIAYCREELTKPVSNRPGEVVIEPRLRTWEHTQSFLLRPREFFAGRSAASLNKDDMGAILDAIKSPSSSNRTRQNLFAMCRWAMETTNPKTRRPYLATNWFNDFTKRRKKEAGVQKRLKGEPVGEFWHALNNPECPGTAHAKRALQLILCTALRPKEVLSIRRNDVIDLHGDDPRVVIQPSAVKKIRYMVVPLNSLAVEIITAALASHDCEWLFPGQTMREPYVRASLSSLMTGSKRKPGIMEWLGWKGTAKQITPHALRRTAASLLRAKGFGYSLEEIAFILDHQSDDEHKTTSGYADDFSVHDDHGDDFHEKRRELETALEKALRAVIDPPPSNVTQLKQAA